MIKKLSVKRFKSILDLSLGCKKINIFIGGPNTGKSNILETLGLMSFLGYYFHVDGSAKSFIRFELTSNLFYDEDLEHPFEISCDTAVLSTQFVDGRFSGQCNDNGSLVARIEGGHENLRVLESMQEHLKSPFKFYRFNIQETFPERETGFLLPPSGSNLVALLLTKKDLRAVVNQPFSSMGLRLGLRPQEQKIEVVKQFEDVIVSYPYSLTSETFQRLTFYIAAILSNKDSVLIFEEPEAHAFPYYVNYLAELIALDQNQNQYFISTHNPGFLLPIIAKAPKDDVSVNVVYFDDYQTKVKKLTQKQLQDLMENDVDVLYNLDRYIPGR